MYLLHSVGIYGRTAKKRPFISEKNMKNGLHFAKSYIHKLMEFWETIIIFSDESKNIFGSDGKRFVWRRPPTDGETRWGCLPYNEVRNLAFIDVTMQLGPRRRRLEAHSHENTEVGTLQRD